MENLSDDDVGLIQVPHKLDIIAKDFAFSKIEVFDRLLRFGRDHFNFIRAKKKRSAVQSTFRVTRDDVLFVYTEYELMNQCIIEHFKDSGAQVYLIEDGGFATYITCALVSDAKLPFREQIKLFLIKMVLGYKKTKFIYLNNMSFPQIADNYIDGVILYRDVEITRNMNKIVIGKHVKQVSCSNENSVLFLNEKMYDYYMSFDEYLIILKDILTNLSKCYAKVYFKFHPRENLERQRQILPMINNIVGLEVIEDETAIENIITKVNVKNIASFFSAALLNLYDAGLTPIYVFHKYDVLMKQNMFINVKKILMDLGYNFFINWEDLGPDFVGFNSKYVSAKMNIKDLILKSNSSK